ncbi:MAG: hypothetical protein ABI036_04340, partial [Fibrobacteria bacterium]
KSNKDAGDMGGFGQPDLAVKYTLPQYGAGAFVDLTLPFVTGNLDFPFEPAMGLALGAVYQNRFGNFRITGMADYQINFENKDKIKLGNVFLLYAKPEAMWTEFIGTYLGIKYAMIGESAFDGRSNSGSDGYLLTLLPGINTQLTKSLAYEINVPFTLMGKNTNSSWGISANFYATLPLVN